MANSRLSPLQHNVRIVNDDGTPDPYFTNWINQLMEEKLNTDTLAEEAVPSTRLIDTDSPLSGGGDLSSNRTLSLDDSPVVPGVYGDVTNYPIFEVDQFGRVIDATEAALPAGGGGSSWTKYEVAAPGDVFIAVPLDADNGEAYEVMFEGKAGPTAGTTSLYFQVSSDDAATFHTGGTDYKSGTSGSASFVSLTGTVGGGRNVAGSFVLGGMNAAGGARFTLAGYQYGVGSTGSGTTGTVGGTNNHLAAGNFNGFRIASSGGIVMNDVVVYVRKIF
jgi:hypothetical protein